MSLHMGQLLPGDQWLFINYTWMSVFHVLHSIGKSKVVITDITPKYDAVAYGNIAWCGHSQSFCPGAGYMPPECLYWTWRNVFITCNVINPIIFAEVALLTALSFSLPMLVHDVYKMGNLHPKHCQNTSLNHPPITRRGRWNQKKNKQPSPNHWDAHSHGTKMIPWPLSLPKHGRWSVVEF